MNKKFHTILFYCLAVIVTVSVTALSLLSCSPNVSDNGITDSNTETDTSKASIPEAKTFTTSDGAKIELKLKDNQAFADDGKVAYTDDIGSTYVFDSNDNLSSVRSASYEDEAFSAMRDDPSLRVKEAEAKNAAVTFGKNMLGEKFDKYNTVDCAEDDDSASYLFSFKMVLGENGFIGGPVCNVRVRYDGKIDSMHVGDTTLYDKVDVSILEGITEKEVYDHVNKVVSESCTTTSEFTSITPTSSYIENVDGKFVIITEVKLISKIDILNKIYGDISVDTNHPSVWKYETYNSPNAMNVLVIFPLK